MATQAPDFPSTPTLEGMATWLMAWSSLGVSALPQYAGTSYGLAGRINSEVNQSTEDAKDLLGESGMGYSVDEIYSWSEDIINNLASLALTVSSDPDRKFIAFISQLTKLIASYYDAFETDMDPTTIFSQIKFFLAESAKDTAAAATTAAGVVKDTGKAIVSPAGRIGVAAVLVGGLYLWLNRR